jgi:hypothetical protein
MRARAALVGGTLAVETSPGGGTTVYVRLPVHPAEDPSSTHRPLGDQPSAGLAAPIPQDGPVAGQDSDT